MNARKQVVPLRFIDDPSVMPGILLCHRNWIDFSADYDLGLESICRLLQGDTGALLNPPLPTITGVKPFDFAPIIAEHYTRFTGREWLREEVSRWLRQPDTSRALVLVGARGVGKSAITAWLSQVLAKDVVAVHFCTDRNTSTTNPHQFVASLVAQLHAQLPNYAHRVEGLNPADRRETAEEAFRQLIVEPISKIWPDVPKVMLVDSLDEAQRRQSGATVADILERHANDLPDWLRIVATTRPEEPVLKRIKPLDRFDIESQGKRNLRDINQYLSARLAEPSLADRLVDDCETVAQQLAKVVAGNFEYARLAADALDEGSLRPDQLDGMTTDLLDFYSHSFRDQFGTFENYERTCGPLLNALAVARAPLPLATLKRLSGESPAQVQQRIVELQRFLRVSGTDQEPYYELAHESIRDWLMDRSRSKDFACDAQESCLLLADALWDEWRDNEYALQYLPIHLIEAERWDQLEELLTDLFYLEAKCSAGQTFDLVRDYKTALGAHPELEQQRDTGLARITMMQDYGAKLIQYAKAYGEGVPLPEPPDTQPVIERFRIAQAQTSAHYRPPESNAERIQAFANFVTTQSHTLSRFPQETIAIARNHAEVGLLVERGEILFNQATRPSIARDPRPAVSPTRPLCQQTIQGHTDDVNCVAITPDGLCAVSVSTDTTLKVWDLETGAEEKTLQGHTSSVRSVAITPDGRCAVSASWDKTLKVWDLEVGSEVMTLDGHVDRVTSVAITPDGRLAVSASWDKTVKVWDLEVGSEVMTLDGHVGGVTSVAITPDGHRVVSASNDETLKVWDLETGAEKRTLHGHTGSVESVTITPDGHRAISASNDRTLKVWDLENGFEVMELHGHVGGATSVAITPDGRRLLSSSKDRTLKEWDLQTGAEAMTLDGHTGRVFSVVITPDGRRAVSSSSDEMLKVWDLETGAEQGTLNGHVHYVNSIAITQDGRRVISASNDETLKIWDLETGAEERTFLGHHNEVNSVAITPDGRRAVSASYKTLRVWDLETGFQKKTLLGHSSYVNSVAILPDGLRAVSASSDRTLKVWDLETGSEERTLLGHTGEVQFVTIMPDGLRAVSASDDRTLKVWDLQAGSEERTLKNHIAMAKSLVITPDGLLAVSASEDKTLNVMDLETGRVVKTLHGHTGDVNSLAITSDSRRLVSGSFDNTLKVWDLETGVCESTYPAAEGVVAVAVHGTDRIVCGTANGQLHFLTMRNFD